MREAQAVGMMHADEVRLDVDVARALIVDQFPCYRSERIDRLAQAGTVNAIFRIGAGVAARFPLRPVDPEVCAMILHREADAMAAFAACCSCETPRPRGIGKPGSGYPMPWALQTWVDGEAATADGLARSPTFATDVAALIATLRTAATNDRRFSGTGRGGDLRDHDAWMAVCLHNSEGLLDVPRLRALWARLRELPSRGAPAMSHKDLTPANLLVRGGRLQGVLDCGGFGVADRALDLVAAWHMLDRERREIVRHELGVGDIEWRRGAAWAFEQAMGLVWYYRGSNPTMSMLGRSTLGRLLDDPEI